MAQTDQRDRTGDYPEFLPELHGALRASGRSVAVAESCTGGRLSHLLTRLAGASAYFRSGWVVYTESAKRSLGVPASALADGVVTAAAARAMAEAARRNAGADYGLATTGNLGPDVLEDKPAGRVFVACAGADGTTVQGYDFEGGRERVRDAAAEAALRMLADALSPGRDRNGKR